MNGIKFRIIRTNQHINIQFFSIKGCKLIYTFSSNNIDVRKELKLTKQIGKKKRFITHRNMNNFLNICINILKDGNMIKLAFDRGTTQDKKKNGYASTIKYIVDYFRLNGIKI